jgi:hypothetical protein
VGRGAGNCSTPCESTEDPNKRQPLDSRHAIAAKKVTWNRVRPVQANVRRWEMLGTVQMVGPRSAAHTRLRGYAVQCSTSFCATAVQNMRLMMMETETQDLELRHHEAHHNERIIVRQTALLTRGAPQSRGTGSHAKLNWTHTLEEASRRGPQFSIHSRCTRFCD